MTYAVINNVKYEFETPIHGYNATPFLVMYSVDAGQPVLENVLYDSLELSITDLPVEVSRHIHNEIGKNLKFVVSEALEAFLSNMKTLSTEKKNMFSSGAGTFLKNLPGIPTENVGQLIRQTLRDMQKNIKENEASMKDMLGSTFGYFKEAKFYF